MARFWRGGVSLRFGEAEPRGSYVPGGTWDGDQKIKCSFRAAFPADVIRRLNDVLRCAQEDLAAAPFDEVADGLVERGELTIRKMTPERSTTMEKRRPASLWKVMSPKPSVDITVSVQ